MDIFYNIFCSLCFNKNNNYKDDDISDEILYNEWENDFNKYSSLNKTQTSFYSSISIVET